ncbi:hypothetical protein BGW39_008693, partial [Mortierella sp. 14UC]
MADTMSSVEEPSIKEVKAFAVSDPTTLSSAPPGLPPSTKDEKAPAISDPTTLAPLRPGLPRPKVSVARRLKRTITRLFRNPSRINSKEVFNAIVSVPLVPAGVLYYYRSDNKHVSTAIGTYGNTLGKMIFFTEDFTAHSFTIALPILGARFDSTTQLAHCSRLLRRYGATSTPTATTATDTTATETTAAETTAAETTAAETTTTTTTATPATVKPLSPAEKELIQPFIDDKEEQEYIFWMVHKVVKVFITEPLRTPETLAEVLLLGPSLDRTTYRQLLNFLIAKFEGAKVMDIELLQAMVQMVEGAGPDYLNADDLVKISDVLRTCLEKTHSQSTEHKYRVALALSRLLDVMVEGHVQQMSRVTQHEPLTALLSQLAGSSDMYLKNQGTYALQALANISNDESRRDFVLRHAGNIALGLLGVASVLKLDFSEVADGATQLYKFAVDVQETTSKLAEGALSLQESGLDIVTSIRDSIMNGARRVWYPALREAEQAIRDGRLATFNRLVIQALCRREVEFQWGICQLLGEIAMDELWDVNTRKLAVDFLAEHYKDDSNRKQDVMIDRRLLDTLRQIAAVPGSPVSTYAQTQYQELKEVGTRDRQNHYRTYDVVPLPPYIPKARLFNLQSSPLLEQVQKMPNVDRRLRWLRGARLNEPELHVYIPLQAKPTAQSANDSMFSLMNKTMEFLTSPCQ